MAIRYIPTEYRKPALSTMGYFAQGMQPLLQMFIQHQMQKDMLDKQIEVDKTRVDAANKEWDRRFTKTKEAQIPSLAKTLYDEYGLIKMDGKGFAKFDKKSGKISMVSIPEADNIKNEQLAKWIADKTLIPVDANYSAGSPNFKYQDTNYYFNPKEKIKEPYEIGQIKEFKEGDKYINKAYLGQGKWKKTGEAPRYKPGVTINQQISTEKFGLSKDKTVIEIRPKLTDNTDKEFHDTNAAFYNRVNRNNEIAYWESKPGELWGTNEKTKIMKLPTGAIKKGWTPYRIQEEADKNGMSVADFLTNVLKIPLN